MGLWPFAISIIVFSLIIGIIGYKTTAFIAMGCRIASLVLTLVAKTPTALYWSVFLIAPANVESGQTSTWSDEPELGLQLFQ